MRRLILILATGFGLGYLPGAPGTYGSLLGLCFYRVLSYLPIKVYVVTVFVSILVAAWLASEAANILSERDPRRVVIDEVVGMVVALFFIPFHPKAILLSFALFRLLDIWKPFPCRWIERRLPGGWGIVGDDLMAAIYTNLIMQLVIRIHGFL